MYNEQNEHIPNMQISFKEQTLEAFFEYLEDLKKASNSLLAGHSFIRNQFEDIVQYIKSDKEVLEKIKEEKNTIINTQIKKVESSFNGIEKLLNVSKDKYSEGIKQVERLEIQEEKDKHADRVVMERLEFLKKSIYDLLCLSIELCVCKLNNEYCEYMVLCTKNDLCMTMPTIEETSKEQTPESLKAEHELLTKQFDSIFNKITECAQEIRELGQKPEKIIVPNSLRYI